MRNHAEAIEEAADGEPIEGIVIGKTYGRKESPPKGLLTWDEARPFLDYSYYTGFGGADCHPVYAWTATKLIGVHEYDGSTSITVLPRHPSACDADYL